MNSEEAPNEDIFLQDIPSVEVVTKIHICESQNIQSLLPEVSQSCLTLNDADSEETALQLPEPVGYGALTWTNNILVEYEDGIKKASYIILAALCVFVAVGYVYSQPGSTVQVKWKRSFKKVRRLSRSTLPSFKDIAPNVYPFIKDFVHVAHVILNHMFD